MAEKYFTLVAFVKRAEEAELALKTYNDNFPNLNKEWMSEGIKSCVDEELAKEFHADYDFALDKLNLSVDHELQVAVERPKEPKEDEEEEEEEWSWPRDQKMAKLLKTFPKLPLRVRLMLEA